MLYITPSVLENRLVQAPRIVKSDGFQNKYY